MDFTPITRIGLLLVRPGMLVMATPILGGTFAPATVKVGLTAILGLVMMPMVSLPAELSTTALAVIVLREAVIGLALAMAVRVVVGGAEVAGQLVGFQVGLLFAAVVDPQSGVRNNVVSTLYASLAVLMLLATNTHHALIGALADSYTALPPGAGEVSGSLVGAVARMFTMVFVLGLRLAMPVVIVLLLLELALGLISRAAPALNLMVIGFPLRLLLGLAALAITVNAAPSVLAHTVGPALEWAVRIAAAFH